MLVMAGNKPFAPTIYGPEKRNFPYTLRLTNSEHEILEGEAARRGMTALNLVRQILADKLGNISRRRKTKR